MGCGKASPGRSNRARGFRCPSLPGGKCSICSIALTRSLVLKDQDRDQLYIVMEVGGLGKASHRDCYKCDGTLSFPEAVDLPTGKTCSRCLTQTFMTSVVIASVDFVCSHGGTVCTSCPHKKHYRLTSHRMLMARQRLSNDVVFAKIQHQRLPETCVELHDEAGARWGCRE